MSVAVSDHSLSLSSSSFRMCSGQKFPERYTPGPPLKTEGEEGMGWAGLGVFLTGILKGNILLEFAKQSFLLVYQCHISETQVVTLI